MPSEVSYQLSQQETNNAHYGSIGAINDWGDFVSIVIESFLYRER